MSETAASSLFGVFTELSRCGVRWCLWRGSARTERALAGTSDLDVLVDADDQVALAQALHASGYRRTRGQHPEPGLEDWFGLGGPLGPLLHVHVHYRLVAGEPRYNRFHLPWEREVLDARKARSDGSVAADPVHECALLLLRCALQLRWRDRWPGVRSGARLLAKVRADLDALVPQQDHAAVIATMCRWLGRDVVVGLDTGALNLLALARVRRAAAAALAPLASRGGVLAACTVWWRELVAAARVAARRLGWSILPWRGCLRGGAIIVIVAGDAGLRRAVARQLHDLLRSKIDVRQFDHDVASRRAMRARACGMIAIVDAAVRPDVAHGRLAPDLVIELDATGSREAAFATVLAAAWRLF